MATQLQSPTIPVDTVIRRQCQREAWLISRAADTREWNSTELDLLVRCLKLNFTIVQEARLVEQRQIQRVRQPNIADIRTWLL